MQIVKPTRPQEVFRGHGGVILTDDSQFEIIARDPAAPLFEGEGRANYLYPPDASLISLMDQAAKRGAGRFMVSYDFFFGGQARRLHLDSPETLAAFEVIARLARERGMTLEGSVINPLDLGRGYAAKHDHAGEMCLFQEGRIAADGRYRMTLRAQAQWCNNKGPISLQVKAVKVFAFAERRVPGTSYFAVDPRDIVDISDTVERAEPAGEVTGPAAGWREQPYRVEGRWPQAGKDTRCLVVLVHALPELDYFNPDALEYAKGVINEYHRRGIDFAAFYGDEMHSQFDWDLRRVGREELQVRYVTPSMCRAFARAYGREFADLYKYLVYFCQGHGCLDGEQAIDGTQHVMGADRESIYRTWMFRRNYFDMLSAAVVGLSLEAKRYAERLYGRPVEVTAHPTWQEAPTCDDFGAGCGGDRAHSYDYTDAFRGSASVREAISACYDYWRWNRVYTGCGTDHPEGGWADRNYFGRAFACGLGTINDAGWTYCASWGAPAEIIARMNQVTAAYGCRHSNPLHNVVQGEVHRDTDVLLLYPLDLLYVDQRFGSWMVQYGYCNYATEEELCRWGRVTADGRLSLRGRRYRVVGALFEPFVRPKTLDLMAAMLARGGSVLWMATPPERYEEGTGSPLARWQRMFGVTYERPPAGGAAAGGKNVRFAGAMSNAAPMEVPSDLLPDWIYPVKPDNADAVARIGTRVVGAIRCHRGGGRAMFLGFRARDDQSASTGKDIRVLFDALSAAGAYTGDDHPERMSRTGDVLANKFPNGVVTVTNHFRSLPEQWPGGFKRDPERDAPIVARLNLPPNEVRLDGVRLDGHTVTYRGTEMVSYRVASGKLTAFCGRDTTGIKIDGTEYRFAEQPLTIAWAEVARRERASAVRTAHRLWVSGPCEVTLPVDARGWQSPRGAVASGADAAGAIAVRAAGDALVVSVAPGQEGRWLYVGDW
ncbi:MAG: hypothetical protein JSV65_19630 [Armatimonadota bacterium]|nr:MAG: hypothetical protein JSV65_19630 [Armatimonadota bacterium]